MITINRTLEGIEDLIPHLIIENEQQRVLFAQQLMKMIQQTPEKLFVVQARSDDELVGFIIAQAIEDYVYIAQAWTKKDLPNVTTEMFNRIVLWSIGLGMSKIQAQTTRSTEALFRRFGFVETAKVVTHVIRPEILPNLMSTMKGLTNGKPVQQAEASV